MLRLLTAIFNWATCVLDVYNGPVNEMGPKKKKDLSTCLDKQRNDHDSPKIDQKFIICPVWFGRLAASSNLQKRKTTSS